MQAVRKTKINEICIAAKIICAQGKQQLQKHPLGWELPQND
jgi:hypothetical protein